MPSTQNLIQNLILSAVLSAFTTENSFSQEGTSDGISSFTNSSISSFTNSSISNLYNPSTTNKPLVPIEKINIGEKVPNIKFNILNSDSTFAYLENFKGRLILLDFFATWCSPCIEKFPEIDTLQKYFADKIQIILVNSADTRDTKSSISNLLTEKSKYIGPNFKPLIAYNDSIALSYFPHNEVPHYAWINGEGRLIAITASEQITKKNIESVLKKEEQLKLIIKKDHYANKLDLPIENVTVDDDLFQYKFFRKGILNGMAHKDQLRIQKIIRNGEEFNISRGKMMINMPLMDMYFSTISLNKELRKIYTPKRLLLEIKDSSRLFSPEDKESRKEWLKTNLYSYDVVIPSSETDNLYESILKDLNNFSGYNGRIETRKVKCLALVQTIKSDTNKTKSKVTNRTYLEGGFRLLQNCTTKELATELEFVKSVPYPVIDRTGYNSNIDIKFSMDPKNYYSVRKSLNLCNLDLIEIESEIEVFVLTER